MGTIGEWLMQTLGEKKPEGEPSALAPISVQAAYQSAQRTGANAPTVGPASQDQAALSESVSGTPTYQQQDYSGAPAATKTAVVFPEDIWRKSVDEVKQKRIQAMQAIGQVATVSKEGDPLIKSMHDQLNAALPEPAKHFGEAEPQVKQLSEKLLSEDLKRDAIARMIASQIEAIDKPIPRGISPSEHAANLIDKLGGSFLKVTNGVMGTSDAVAENEAARLMGGASSSYFNYRNLFKEGKHLIKPQVEDLQKYKSTLVDVMHSMQDVSNSGFNKLAKVSSPEFAEKSLGGNILSPYTGKIAEKYGTPIEPTKRISREQSEQAPKGENGSNVIKRTYVGGRFQ